MACGFGGVRANGFSHRTCLPASAAVITTGGVHRRRRRHRHGGDVAPVEDGDRGRRCRRDAEPLGAPLRAVGVAPDERDDVEAGRP